MGPRPRGRLGLAVPGHRGRRLRHLLGGRLLRRHRAAGGRRAADHRPGHPRGRRPAADRAAARAGRDPGRARRPRLRRGAADLRRPAGRQRRQRPRRPDRPRASARSGTGSRPGRCTPATPRSTTTSDRAQEAITPRRPRTAPSWAGSPRSAPRSATSWPASSSCCSRRTSSSPTATGSGPGWCGSRRAPPAQHVDSSGRVAWISLTQFVRATVIVAATDAIGIMIVRRDPRGAVRARDRRAGLPRRVHPDGRCDRRRHRRGAGRAGRPGPDHRAADARRRDPRPADRGPRPAAVPDGPLGLGAPARA